MDAWFHRLVLLLLLLLSASATAQAADAPNILWVIAEDLGPALSCYGNTDISTPNLDRFAAEGVRYSRAYTTAPVCSASRSAFMTGMYQTTIGAQNGSRKRATSARTSRTCPRRSGSAAPEKRIGTSSRAGPVFSRRRGRISPRNGPSSPRSTSARPTDPTRGPATSIPPRSRSRRTTPTIRSPARTTPPT